jgi:hypothetical protein
VLNEFVCYGEELTAERWAGRRILFPPLTALTRLSPRNQFQPVWDLIVRAEKGKMGKMAEHPFEGIQEMQELDLTECKLEGRELSASFLHPTFFNPNWSCESPPAPLFPPVVYAQAQFRKNYATFRIWKTCF